MDETDVKLLGKLLSDARLSYRRIADEIGVSAPTVLARVKKLEKDRVIKFYSAILDHEKLGYDLTAIIEVTSVKGKIAEVEKHISKFSNVCAAPLLIISLLLWIPTGIIIFLLVADRKLMQHLETKL